ncbi:hypothetical protein LCGC14_1394810 [marine sediment metagenome]|uniref:SCP domain-containing protein n=1 Tax=marine sediment metagenome TaxID=412755 RepID=A0A0F9MEE7_9ZZZZ
MRLAIAAIALVLVLLAVRPVGCQTATLSAGNEIVLLDLINDYRVENGLEAVVVEPRLMAAAQWKAEDLLTQDPPSHIDLLGRSPFERMTAFGYGEPENYLRGEVLAFTLEGPQDVLQLWKESVSHNAALVRPDFDAIGIGHAGDWWAVNLGHYYRSTVVTPAPMLPTPTPVPTPTPTPCSQ